VLEVDSRRQYGGRPLGDGLPASGLQAVFALCGCVATCCKQLRQLIALYRELAQVLYLAGAEGTNVWQLPAFEPSIRLVPNQGLLLAHVSRHTRPLLPFIACGRVSGQVAAWPQVAVIVSSCTASRAARSCSRLSLFTGSTDVVCLPPAAPVCFGWDLVCPRCSCSLPCTCLSETSYGWECAC
jgi:hypothetical protein